MSQHPEDELRAAEEEYAGQYGGGASAASSSGLRLISQDEIRDIFEFYCNFGRSSAMNYQETLDSFMFMKFARECPGLLDRNLTPTEIDLIFVKAKPKFERRLDLEHFLDALSAIAERKFPKHPPRDGLLLLLGHHLAPHHDLVREEMLKTGETEIPLEGIYKKLYDPRSYTGVYAERFRSGDGRINGEADNRPGRGFKGSTNTGTNERIHDVSVLMRPELHGAGTMMSPANHSLMKRRGTSRGRAVSPTLSRIGGGDSASVAGGGGSASPGGGNYYSSSASVASAGGLSMSGRSASRPGSPRASHHEAPSPRRTVGGGGGAAVGRSPAGPSSASYSADTIAAALEKARTGDSTDLESLAISLSETVKRLQATNSALRSDGAGGGGGGGTRSLPSSPAPPAASHYASASSPHVPSTFASSRGGEGGGSATSYASTSNPALSQLELRQLFEFYCNFGRSSAMNYQDSLDSFMFMKFARECPGLLDRYVTPTDVDLIFTKAKPKYERRLKYTNFLDALAALAEKKYHEETPEDGLRLLLARNLSPHYEIVMEESKKTGETEIPLEGIYKKLYDPRSYTGVYAERFRSADGRINGEADNRPGRTFKGFTNTGTNEVIHDISVLMRPNLRSGTMMTSRPVTPGGSPRPGSPRSSSPRAARSPSIGGGLDARSVASSRR